MAVDALPISAQSPAFTELKRIVNERGLLDRQPLYYGFRVPLTMAALIPGIAVSGRLLTGRTGEPNNLLPFLLTRLTRLC